MSSSGIQRIEKVRAREAELEPCLSDPLGDDVLCVPSELELYDLLFNPTSYCAPLNSHPASSNSEAVETAPKMSYFFSTPVDIDIVLEDGDERQMVDMKTEKGRREKAPLYKDGESVKGAVTIRPKDGKRLEHTGIKVQFIGTI
ncbi:unnamed protein product, partial [Diplocarpon coronariae]